MSDGGFGYSSSNTPYSGDPAANSFVQSQVPSSAAVVTGAGGGYQGNYSSGYSGGTGHQSASDASNASVVTGAGGGNAATGGHQNSLATANAAFNAGVNVGHAIGSGAAGGAPTGSAASDFHAGMAALPGDIAAINAMSAIPRETLMSHQDWSGAGGSGYDGYLRYMASGGQVDNPVRVAAIGAPVVPATSDMPPDLFPGAPTKIGPSPAAGAAAASGGPSVPGAPVAAVRQPTDPGQMGAGTVFGAGSDTNPYPPDSAAYLAWNAERLPGQVAQAAGDIYNAAGEATKVAAGAAGQIVVDAAGQVWKRVMGPSQAEPPPIAPAVPAPGQVPSGRRIGEEFVPPTAAPVTELPTGPGRSPTGRRVATETVTGGPIQEPTVPPSTEQSVSIPHAAGPGIQAAANAAGLLPASSSVPPDVTASATIPTGGPGTFPVASNEPGYAIQPSGRSRIAESPTSPTSALGEAARSNALGAAQSGSTGAATPGAPVPYPTDVQMPQPLGPTAPQMYLRSGYTSAKMASSVKSAQNLLKSAGYDISADGKFGKETVDAVKAFQKKMGLQVDGIVGPNTWAALTSSGGSKSNALGMSQRKKKAA